MAIYLRREVVPSPKSLKGEPHRFCSKQCPSLHTDTKTSFFLIIYNQYPTTFRARHGSGRPLVRGARIKSKDQDGDKGDGDEPGPSGKRTSFPIFL